MPRCLLPGRVYLVTRRCTQRQLLLRPDPETTNAFIYCLAVAALRTNVDVVAFLANSNHHHTIVVDRRGNLPEFLECLHKLVARHQNVLRRRRENFWASEPTSVVELVEPHDILAKVVYALTNPVKDHLVARANQWPGASSLVANLQGRVLRAKRPWRFFRKDGQMPESVTLGCVRPPGFEDLSPEEWSATLDDQIRAFEASVEADLVKKAQSVMGRAQVLRQEPTDRPGTKEQRGRLKPRFAAAEKSARIEAAKRNKVFLQVYRVARRLWQSGLDALFPAGTYWLRRFAGVPVAPTPI